MKKILTRTIVLLLILALLAPAVSVGAFALSSRDPLLYANLSRADFEFSYTPFANSEYALYLFSADGGAVHARAELLLSGEIIAEGEGRGEILSAWLVAGENYTIRVRGSGSAVIEVARSTLSRCYSDPMVLSEGKAQGKMIARDYDAHWYRFTAEESTLLMITGMPEDKNIALAAQLFDDGGNMISRFERLSGGACMLLAGTEAGRDYYLRVCAPEGGTGYYSLNLNRSHGPEFASPLRFTSAEYTIAAGSEMDMNSLVSGAPLLWVSENPEIAMLSQDGRLLGLSEGIARITAYGMSSSAGCTVRVEHVPLERIIIPTDHIRLSAGESMLLPIQCFPENATQDRLRYISGDNSIAAMNRSGMIEAVAPGETTLTVRNAEGTITAMVPITVSPAKKKYRALLVGEQNYPFSENSVRTGSDNSVHAIENMLGNLAIGEEKFSVRTASDLSKAELIAEIRHSFADASEQDVSLLYITCHGSYRGGMSFLELSDGSFLSARDLERELRSIPGTIVLLIDCCGSGGAIGAASDRADFARGITGAFSGAAVRGSKYKVICSAGLDQDSFRLALNEEAQSGVMATVFARALCDGAGWSIDRASRTAMGADMDYDGAITLNELYIYMEKRVNWYLEIASELTGGDYRQSVMVYPEGDPFILFER